MVRAVVVRFAEIVCPPGVRVGRRADRVLAEFVLMLRALPPAARRALLGAFIAIDQGARLYPPARGRRFARLDDQTADAYLRALLGRGNGTAALAQRLKGLLVMCYYELPEVKREIGYDPDPYIATVSKRRLERYGSEIAAAERQARQAEQAEQAEQARQAPPGVIGQNDVTADMDIDCDVVIVGSGAGGATMAAELAAAGIDVVIIEEGGYHPTESFQAKSMRALRTLYRDGGGGMTIGKPSVLFAEGRCVGGSTVVNGGMSWRTPPHILDRWATQEQITDLSEEDMAPFFAKAEAQLSVKQQDPETIGRDSQLLKVGADVRGWHIVPNQRNQLHCAGTNNCNNGCPTGAKRSMLVTSVPRALAKGARLFADCRVDRITMSGTRATGVTARFLRPGRADGSGRADGPSRGPKLTVKAKVVVVACGAIQTPALLARSGIRGASGQLGRNLSMHPNAMLVACFDEEVKGWHGVHQAFQVREFMAEGIILTANNLAPPMLAAILPGHGRELGDLMAGYNHIVTAGPLIEDDGTGRIHQIPGVGPQVFYRLTDRDAAKVTRGVLLTAEAMFAAGARRVLLPFDGAPEMRSPQQARKLLSHPVPKQVMRLFSVHLMGTARMSEDPRRGVTDGHGMLHGTKNLMIADASLFPGPTGLNPMETVIALVARNARHLITHRTRYGI